MIFFLNCRIHIVINLLYCFDQNYNIQAFTSIMSLILKTNNFVNIFIIHEDPKSFKIYKNKIQENKQVNKVEIYEFNKRIDDYPNLKNTHVSKATYYRLFIEDYLPKDLDFLLYLDPDVLCIDLYEDLVTDQKNKLVQSNFIVSAHSEYIKGDKKSKDTFERLELNGNKYFNAGVMLIDFKKWISNNISENLINHLHENKGKIVFWDQDVMNKYFDGFYQELSERMNFQIPIDENEYDKLFSKREKKDIIFIHYAGKFKPWTVKGIFHPAGIFYQKVHRKVSNKKYHISNNWKKIAIIDFLKYFFSFKLKRIDHPFHFVKDFINYIVSSNSK